LLARSNRKDVWDKITASAGILSFVSGILIAGVGGYFTYSYNQRQIDLNRNQVNRDGATKEQANKVLELEAIQKLIPVLTSTDEKGKAAALVAIQDLAHPELAAHLAELFKGQGGIQYLQQAASSSNPREKQVAVKALSSIASGGNTPDSRLASRALSDVFAGTRQSVVRVESQRTDAISGSVTLVSGSGVILTRDGYILTSGHLAGPSGSQLTLKITTVFGQVYKPVVVAIDPVSTMALLKVDGVGLHPAHITTAPIEVGSDAIGIGYALGNSTETAFVGHVARFDGKYIYFDNPLAAGVTGGPLLGNNGDVIGLMYGTENSIGVAIPIRMASGLLAQAGIPLSPT